MEALERKTVTSCKNLSPKTWSDERSFPKRVHLQKKQGMNITWRMDDLGSVVGMSAPFFTIEIRAIVKNYGLICACIQI